MAAGAHSIARSAWSGNASSSTSGQAIPCSSRQGLRLGAIARGRAGERHAGHALGEPPRQCAADRAEAGNGDARRGHRGS
jgi:hypothetical protein